jgi:hypothetical protein
VCYVTLLRNVWGLVVAITSGLSRSVLRYMRCSDALDIIGAGPFKPYYKPLCVHLSNHCT